MACIESGANFQYNWNQPLTSPTIKNNYRLIVTRVSSPSVTIFDKVMTGGYTLAQLKAFAAKVAVSDARAQAIAYRDTLASNQTMFFDAADDASWLALASNPIPANDASVSVLTCDTEGEKPDHSDEPLAPPPITPPTTPPDPYTPDPFPPTPFDPPLPEEVRNYELNCCQNFNIRLTQSSTVAVYLRDTASNSFGRLGDSEVTLNVEENTVSFNVIGSTNAYFLMFADSGTCASVGRNTPTNTKRSPKNKGSSLITTSSGVNAFGTLGATLAPGQSGSRTARTSDLKGFSLKLKNGRPEQLTGRAKLEHDIGLIVYSVLKDDGLLKRTLSDADRGFLSKRIKDELEDPRNWWSAQSTPISFSQVQITRRTVSSVGGVEVSGAGDEWLIRIGYTELSTGVQIDVDGRDALIIPFGAEVSL